MLSDMSELNNSEPPSEETPRACGPMEGVGEQVVSGPGGDADLDEFVVPRVGSDADQSPATAQSDAPDDRYEPGQNEPGQYQPGQYQPGQREMSSGDGLEPARPRRVRLPVILFLATCLSTFWVGVNHWFPYPLMGTIRQELIAHWQDGLVYTGCLLAILVAHEMGHFLTTLRYRVPASFPYFIPFPISPIGTMGAVIGMDGLRANRKELFDIGLAGPLAGLVVAIPIMWIGITHLDLTQYGCGPFALDLPLITRIGLYIAKPPGYAPGAMIWFSQLNPYFMAGWVGFLITGLNMLPVSQLDGGHVMYTLFGRKRTGWHVAWSCWRSSWWSRSSSGAGR